MFRVTCFTKYVTIALVVAVLMLWGVFDASAGRKAPDFSLKSLDGKTVSLKDYRGQVVLLNFWASGCVFCRMEMPYVVSLNNNYSGVVILSINAFDNKNIMREVAKQFEISYPILIDSRRQVATRYGGVNRLPANFIIDQKGDIFSVHHTDRSGYPKRKS